MIIVDTNILLRYLLEDNEELSPKAIEIMDNNEVFIPTEVIVEVSYVLKKVYNVEKGKIYEAIKLLLDMDDVKFQNKDTIELAFNIYSEKNLDIVDCMLFAYNKNENYDIKTFDKKLDRLINEYKINKK